MTSSNYQLPAIAAVAGLAIAASTLALSSSPQSVEQRRRKRRIKAKLQRGKIVYSRYPDSAAQIIIFSHPKANAIF
jgi:hypothetical protein